jgi:integrase/recombinase XerD
MRRRQRSIQPPAWAAHDQALLARSFSRETRRHKRGPAHKWSKATKRTVLSAYCCGLGWLDDRGQLDWSLPPSARWEAHVLEEYLADLQSTYAKATVYNRVSGLERAIAILEPRADRCLIVSALRWLGKPGRNPVHERRVQSSPDLLQLGLDLMAQAEAGRHRSPRLVATLYRTGLQIALLALRFWRIGEFMALEIGANVFQDRGHWYVHSALSDTPSKRRAKRRRVPSYLVCYLERYLAIYRPRLCDETYRGNALWVSMHSRKQSESSIRQNINKFTRKRFGTHVNPHLFRKCATTTAAVYAPRLMDAVSRMLGHAGPRNRDEHYNLACSLTASRHWNDTVDEILRNGRERRRLLGRRRNRSHREPTSQRNA